jgi:hypothetical protein
MFMAIVLQNPGASLCNPLHKMNSGILAGFQTDGLQALQLSPVSARRCGRHFFLAGKLAVKNSRRFCIVGQNHSWRHSRIFSGRLCSFFEQSELAFFHPE